MTEKEVIIKEKAQLKEHLIHFLLNFALLVIFGINAYMFLHASKRYRVGEISNLNGESLNLLEKSNDINLKINIAYKFYSFADISYSNPKKTKELPKSFVDWKLINKGGKEDENNYYYVFKNEATKQLIFSFPGTTSFYQLLQEFFGSNLKKFDTNDEDILISEYFGSRTLDILEEIFKNEETNNLISKNYSVIVTGHSLGGAIAQSFLYFALKKQKINTENNKPKSITFSQPRVGNKYFVDFLNKKAKFNLRIKNNKDIVTFIPICDLISFFNYSQLFNYFII